MHFKRIVFLLSIFFFLFQPLLAAQDTTAVQWTASGKKTNDGQYEIRLKGIIRTGWHVYAKENKAAGLDGFRISFSDSSIQKEGDPQLSGNFKTITDKIFDNARVEVATDSIQIIQKIKIAGEVPSGLKGLLVFNTANSEAFIPEERKIDIPMEGGVDMSAANRMIIPTIDLKNPVNPCGGMGISIETSTSKGLVTIFFLGFLGGLLALITPCVFPMIPLTVSFFTKKGVSKRRGIFNATLYGFFIFLIYVLLSVPFYFLDSANPEILNSISTSPWLNLGFFAIFLFFAFSFFGYYEISLPGRLSGKADSKAGSGNIIGIFFMALTLAIVSFSCTGPILGSLLVGSLNQDGGAIQLTIGMGGFGLALALPFTLFALFPNWLNSLPKSGGWLNSVKVVLGFIEVGLAIKFLSNADLVKHWGLLKREVFMAIWILVGIGITLYLLGKIKFPHDSKIKKLSRERIMLAILFAAFTIYLLPGVTNTKYANLKLISGFPPPLCYSIYDHPVNCEGFEPLRDYEEALVKARAENKPILIDFTGFACVNCRQMEENVWRDEAVFTLMKERFIVVSLYVDDKEKLPAAKQFTYTTREGVAKDIISVGNKWATFETENFENNAQPLYAIISPGERLMNNPVGYTPSVSKYKEWLLCGLEAFEKSK
ncbi:MAG TPA: cytochrome c biogenesis protein CcdA [Ferruginibacter sp.]|nr:cytochrome c biogenesis protein CcdA [Ferruginibacter sp.]